MLAFPMSNKRIISDSGPACAALFSDVNFRLSRLSVLTKKSLGNLEMTVVAGF